MRWISRFQGTRPTAKKEDAERPNSLCLPEGEPEPVEAAFDGEWEKRILCPDESCIGVIGANGRCKECGKPLLSDLPDDARVPTVSQYGQETTQNDADDNDRPFNLDREWENRKLCVDESCIGVIGSDGRCKVCGKKYTEENQRS